MHILLVTNYFAPDSGAAAVRLTRLANLLHQQGHKLTILTSLPHYPQGKIHPGYRNRWIVREDRGGIEVIQTWLWATPSPRISRKLISQLSFMLSTSLRGLGLAKPDVMLIEAQPIFAGLAGVFLAQVRGIPYVLNVSDLWPDHLLSVGALSADSRIYRTARRMVDYTYRHARQIVAMSPAWAKAIEGYCQAPQKIHVIYNGVDLDTFHPNVDTRAFRERYQLTAEHLVSFIGTFATQYDFETMLAAAERLEIRPDTQILLIGSGSQGEFLKQRLAEEKVVNLRWIEWIDYADIPAAWNVSTVTFWAMRPHPLYQGTIPAKLYEAFACGTPIIAASEGISAEIIRASGAGVAVPCGDVDGLVGAIQYSLDHPDQRKLYSQAARAYAEQHFDPQQVAAAYEAVLLLAAKS